MGMFDFIKEAGVKLFGGGDDEGDTTKTLSDHVRENGLDPSGLKFQFASDGSVTVSGNVASQEDREKIVLIIGNVQGVSQVNDQITVGVPVGDSSAGEGEGEGEDSGGGGPEAAPEWESRTYTVQPGDTLWKISKEMYGAGGKYMTIFEANKPMLSDPDKIYPGQVLRIPNLED